MNQGFKCQDCERYIVPPQIYDEKTIELCHCDEMAIEAFPRGGQVEMPKVDPETVAFNLRRAVLDDLRKPFVPAKVPILVSIPKSPRRPLFERLAGVFAL